MLGKSNYFYSTTTVHETETIDLLEYIKVAVLNNMMLLLKSLYDALATTNVPLNEFGDLIP